MKFSRVGQMFYLLLASTCALGAEGAKEFTGRWEVTTNYPGGFFVARLELSATDQAFEGHSGYLVPDDYWYEYKGNVEKGSLRLKVLAPDGRTAIGELILTARGRQLAGTGILHEI